jgi:hypothetical protein
MCSIERVRCRGSSDEPAGRRVDLGKGPFDDKGGGFRVDVADGIGIGIGTPAFRGDLRFSPGLIAPLTAARTSFAATVRSNDA